MIILVTFISFYNLFTSSLSNLLQNYKFFFIYANFFVTLQPKLTIFIFMAAEDSNKVLYDILMERLELLRVLDKEGDGERRRHVARETAALHAPLAHRLGLYAIKTEMEDLALKFTDYKTYKYIAHALNEKKAQRDAYIASFITPL
jgi:(p)ppGpp synthase/HD superfamily hydrolase